MSCFGFHVLADRRPPTRQHVVRGAVAVFALAVACAPQAETAAQVDALAPADPLQPDLWRAIGADERVVKILAHVARHEFEAAEHLARSGRGDDVAFVTSQAVQGIVRYPIENYLGLPLREPSRPHEEVETEVTFRLAKTALQLAPPDRKRQVANLLARAVLSKMGFRSVMLTDDVLFSATQRDSQPMPFYVVSIEPLAEALPFVAQRDANERLLFNMFYGVHAFLAQQGPQFSENPLFAGGVWSGLLGRIAEACPESFADWGPEADRAIRRYEERRLYTSALMVQACLHGSESLPVYLQKLLELARRRGADGDDNAVPQFVLTMFTYLESFPTDIAAALRDAASPTSRLVAEFRDKVVPAPLKKALEMMLAEIRRIETGS